MPVLQVASIAHKDFALVNPQACKSQLLEISLCLSACCFCLVTGRGRAERKGKSGVPPLRLQVTVRWSDILFIFTVNIDVLFLFPLPYTQFVLFLETSLPMEC